MNRGDWVVSDADDEPHKLGDYWDHHDEVDAKLENLRPATSADFARAVCRRTAEIAELQQAWQLCKDREGGMPDNWRQWIYTNPSIHVVDALEWLDENGNVVCCRGKSRRPVRPWVSREAFEYNARTGYSVPCGTPEDMEDAK